MRRMTLIACELCSSVSGVGLRGTVTGDAILGDRAMAEAMPLLGVNGMTTTAGSMRACHGGVVRFLMAPDATSLSRGLDLVGVVTTLTIRVRVAGACTQGRMVLMAASARLGRCLPEVVVVVTCCTIIMSTFESCRCRDLRGTRNSGALMA